MDYAKCTTPTKDSIVVVQENKSRFEVLNPKRLEVSKIEVDGCLISDHREKCDWIISIDKPKNRVLFIELKGCDIDKAISQLTATLGHTREKYKGYVKECYAVTTRIPKHGSSVRKKCIDFHKKTKTTLHIKNIKTSVAV